MSQNGPKTKSGEVKFFHIDPEGEIKPAYPDGTPPPTEPTPLWNSEATPVEWHNEPQVTEEPAPMWQMDAGNATKEPSVVLENPVASNEVRVAPNPTFANPELTSPGIDMPGRTHHDQHDVPTQHQHELWQQTSNPAPQPDVDEQISLESVSLEKSDAVEFGLPPLADNASESSGPHSVPIEAPDVIIEEWQESDLRDIHTGTHAHAEPADDSEAPQGLTPVHRDDAEEIQDVVHEQEPQASSSADAQEPAQEKEEQPEFTGSDLSLRMRSQMDLLQRQVNTIHGLGPDKKLNDGQLEVLRKYIALKEAESRDLLDQKRQYQAFLQKLDGQLKTFSKKNQALVVELDLLKQRDESNRRDLLAIKEKYKEDVAKIKADYETKLAQSGKMSTAAADFDRKREEWKTKIREELKQIRLKEKELENKYELLKRDTQALLDSKDQHVLELKRKNDALELEMDNLETKLRESNTLLSQMDAKKKRLIETLKLAQALLEQLDKPDSGSGS